MNIEIQKPHLSGAQTIDASRFGLNESSLDNTEAMQRAVSECREAKQPCILVIPEGIYHFAGKEFINFDGLTDFVLDGQGAELIFSGPNFIKFENCIRIEMKNCVLDYNWDICRIANLCRVLWTDRKTGQFELEFFEVEKVAPNIPVMNMNRFHPEFLTAGLPGGKEFWFLEECIASRKQGEKPNSVVYTCKPGRELPLLPQEVYLVRHVERQGCAILLYNCEHITLRNNTIYSALSAGHLIAGGTHHYHLDGEKICLRPGSNRRISTEGDGFHIVQSRGYGIIENCDFSFMGDDDVNVHDVSMMIFSIMDDNKLVSENPGTGNYGSPGDVFEVRNPDFSPAGVRLTLISSGDCDDRRKSVFEFRETIPKSVHPKCILLNRSYCSDYYIIRNNYFHENRARGLLLQCSNGLVENNRFYRTQGAAIYVMLELLKDLWYEGSGVDGLVIRNNTFKDCNCGNWSTVIDCMAYLPDNHSGYKPFRNITIEGNTIDGFPSYAMFIAQTRDVTIRRNKLLNGPDRKTGMALLVCERCENFTVTGNSYEDIAWGAGDMQHVDSIRWRENLVYGNKEALKEK